MSKLVAADVNSFIKIFVDVVIYAHRQFLYYCKKVWQALCCYDMWVISKHLPQLFKYIPRAWSLTLIK